MSLVDSLRKCAVPAVSAMMCFLAYPSQVLFHYIEPQPLSTGQYLRFNLLILANFICYYRVVFTDPGKAPLGWNPLLTDGEVNSVAKEEMQQRQRWCRKCDAVKPPRAHHCKTCKRCILKMDHHCPWTANCVAHRTFPHFVRFLFYGVTSMTYLEYFIVLRLQVLWDKRHLPSYMGPSTFQLLHLLVLVAVNSLLLFAMSILLIRTLWCLGANTTTIEGWEIERHETLVRRARVLGGYLDGPEGSKIRIVKQEFPYDIDIYTNVAQGMGGHIHTWLWPFAATPTVESGLRFPENDIEDIGTSWPPPDPDRLFRFTKPVDSSSAYIKSMNPEVFRKRQEVDMLRQRYAHSNAEVQRRQRFHLRYNDYGQQGNDKAINAYAENSDSGNEGESDYSTPGMNPEEGEEGWRNSEGERLADFGVEEDVEFYDEDDLPLAEIMRRQRAQKDI